MGNQCGRISMLNDLFRQDFSAGQVVMTRGIAELGDETIARIIKAVLAFDDFNDSNDPWQEHDAGGFEIDGQKLYWKIDYYSLDLEMHSPDPADPNVTKRVMTLMRLDEY